MSLHLLKPVIYGVNKTIIMFVIALFIFQMLLASFLFVITNVSGFVVNAI